MSSITDDALFEVQKNQTQFHEPYQQDKCLLIERLKCFLDKIFERAAIKDPFFTFKDVIPSGSTAEGLKVRQLNEFDFLLVLNSNFEVSEDEELMPGYVNIISEENLHPFSLRRKFYRALMSTLKYLELENSVLVTVKIHAVSVKLQIVRGTLDCSHVDVDVDLVLTLKAPQGFWPSCSNEWRERPHNEGLPEEAIQEIRANGVHFVPRFESKSDKQEGTSQSFKWRVSFSVAEGTIISRLKETQKDAFRIMKVILEKQRKKSNWDKTTGLLQNSFVNKITTIYHIKTILLRLNEDASLSELGEREYLICILKALIHSLKNKYLQHYFIPSINLFSALKDLSLGKLWKDLREKMYLNTIREYEYLLETLPEDLSELKSEAIPGQVAIRIPYPLPSSTSL